MGYHRNNSGVKGLIYFFKNNGNNDSDIDNDGRSSCCQNFMPQVDFFF